MLSSIWILEVPKGEEQAQYRTCRAADDLVSFPPVISIPVHLFILKSMEVYVLSSFGVMKAYVEKRRNVHVLSYRLCISLSDIIYSKVHFIPSPIFLELEISTFHKSSSTSYLAIVDNFSNLQLQAYFVPSAALDASATLKLQYYEEATCPKATRIQRAIWSKLCSRVWGRHCEHEGEVDGRRKSCSHRNIATCLCQCFSTSSTPSPLMSSIRQVLLLG